jgi:hypothetical protein
MADANSDLRKRRTGPSLGEYRHSRNKAAQRQDAAPRGIGGV